MTFPYGKTRSVEGGLKARSTRGAIGETWWSKRFLAVLESFALGTRLTRGRAYARKGQVMSLEIEPGSLTYVLGPSGAGGRPVAWIFAEAPGLVATTDPGLAALAGPVASRNSLCLVGTSLRGPGGREDTRLALADARPNRRSQGSRRKLTSIG